MQSGILTESFTADRVAALPHDDWRRRAPEFQQPYLGRNLALRDALRPIAKRHGTSVSAVAIAWTLAWPGVTGAIVGARTPAQVDGWIAAASLDLTAQDVDEIAAAIEHTGAGAGPVRAGQRLAVLQHRRAVKAGVADAYRSPKGNGRRRTARRARAGVVSEADGGRL